MAEKVTIMVLKVDLQCCRCYKKVKKVLCKFPQIRDQIYDEKANTVTITIVCCNPEKIRDKICCKGGESIECIEIKPKKKPGKTKKPASAPPASTPTPPPAPTSPPRPPPTCPPIRFCCTECYHGHSGGPCYFGGAPLPSCPCYKTCGKTNKPTSAPPTPTPAPAPTPLQTPTPPPLPTYPPIGFCCTECSETCGRPVYDSWGSYYKHCYVSHGNCFSKENPQACSIM